MSSFGNKNNDEAVVYEGDPTRHESDDQIRFRQVRQTALKNLQKLEVFTRRLENKLTDSRIQKWITNGAMYFIPPFLIRFKIIKMCNYLLMLTCHLARWRLKCLSQTSSILY
jgi:hypothetical protein